MMIHYDDKPDEIINKVNNLLKKHGLWFEDDGKVHDGYIVYDLKPVNDFLDTVRK